MNKAMKLLNLVESEDQLAIEHIEKLLEKSKGKGVILFGVNVKDMLAVLKQDKRAIEWDENFFNKVDKAIDRLLKTLK